MPPALELLGKIAENPITALVVCLAFGAAAMSGRLSLNVAHWLLFAAVAVAVLGILRSGLKDWRIIMAAILFICSISLVMAYWMNPPKTTTDAKTAIPPSLEAPPPADQGRMATPTPKPPVLKRHGTGLNPSPPNDPQVYLAPDAGLISPENGKGNIVSFAVVNPSGEDITDVRVFTGYFLARKVPDLRISRIGAVIVVPQFDSPLVKAHSEFDFKIDFSSIIDLISKINPSDYPGGIWGIRFAVTFRRSLDGREFPVTTIYQATYDAQDKSVFLITLDASKRGGKNPFTERSVSLSELVPYLVENEDWQPAIFDVNADRLMLR